MPTALRRHSLPSVGTGLAVGLSSPMTMICWRCSSLKRTCLPSRVCGTCRAVTLSRNQLRGTARATAASSRVRSSTRRAVSFFGPFTSVVVAGYRVVPSGQAAPPPVLHLRFGHLDLLQEPRAALVPGGTTEAAGVTATGPVGPGHRRSTYIAHEGNPRIERSAVGRTPSSRPVRKPRSRPVPGLRWTSADGGGRLPLATMLAPSRS